MLKQMMKEILKLLFKKPSKRDIQDALCYDEAMRRVHREWVWNVKSLSNPDMPPFNPDDPSNDFF